MAWWGKLLGGTFGFMMGGPLGAVLGAALGHGLDKGLNAADQEESLQAGDRERIQTAFFTATFSVMGHVAKADGRVSEEEIRLARRIMDEMDLTEDMRGTAIELFNQGKAPGFPLDEVLDQFRKECHRRQSLLRVFVEIQLQAAYADGRMDPAEERLLPYIAERLGFSSLSYRALERMIRAEQGFRREEQRAARCRDVGASRGGGPDDGAVVELLFAPTVLATQECFDQVVSTTQ